MTYTRVELDPMICENPDCHHSDHTSEDGVVLLPRCHPTAGVFAKYFSAIGTLDLRCSVCWKPVAAVLVAKERERLQ